MSEKLRTVGIWFVVWLLFVLNVGLAGAMADLLRKEPVTVSCPQGTVQIVKMENTWTCVTEKEAG